MRGVYSVLMTNVYDTISADAIEVGDLIILNMDELEVTDVIDSGDSIMVKGLSFITGDAATYIVPADQKVDLWTE
jgi:hypothetical protein